MLGKCSMAEPQVSSHLPTILKFTGNSKILFVDYNTWFKHITSGFQSICLFSFKEHYTCCSNINDLPLLKDILQ